MPASTRLIRRRIRSVTNTRKITKAMEMVSSAKMRRAVQAVLGTRPYALLSGELVVELAPRRGAINHPLLRVSEPPKKTLLMAMFSDRGLCGGFNTQLLRQIRSSSLWELQKKGALEVVAVGKRGADAFRRLGIPIAASFVDLSNNPTWLDVRPISRLAINAFLEEKIDEAVIAYMDFRSTVQQIPRLQTILPIKEKTVEVEAISERQYEYLFEPNPDEVLDTLLPRLIETQVFQAVLESVSSEHSARMLAMRNATEAAGEMIDDLTFTFNQIRQAGITREISEISAGKAALE